jgi:tetratricopeptide (TPR) repeat protein
VLKRSRLPHALLAILLVSGFSPRGAFATNGADPAAALARAVAAAESSLRDGELEIAESQYRSALLEGWLLVGALETAGGRPPEAREAFRAASVSAVDARRAWTSLARLQAQAANQGRPAGPDAPEPWAAAFTRAARAELTRRVKADLAHAYQNLGVMQAQGGRYSRAAELFEQAAGADPDSPQIQYSLGVARFNARQFEKATAPLARALAANPTDADLKRMLAMAWLNCEAYARAAELLRDDAGRDADASLQFAYGLALVRMEHAAEAQAVFARLLARHGDSAEVRVVLGQANAQQGDFDAAIQELARALHLKADVAEANATLGVIYLKQGRLAEAEHSLRAELRVRPDDAQSQNALATVLDLQGRPEEALPLLGQLLESKPAFANARYLLGKILLAQGAAQEAVAHLEAAVRLAPEDANIHYQLGRAYQRLGRAEDAEREFEAFRQLKDKRRGSTP